MNFKQYKTYTLLLVFIFILNIGTKAQLTLDSCILYAMEHNLTIKNSQFTVKIAKTDLMQSWYNFLPDASINCGLSQNYRITIDPETNTVINAKNIYNGNVGLSGSIDLFTGFNRLNSIIIERYNLLFEKDELQKTKNKLAFDIITSYNTALFYGEMTKINESQLKISRDLLRQTHVMIEIGKIAESELYNAEAILANDSLNFISIKNLYAENILKLKQLMAYPLNQSLQQDTSLNFFVTDTLNTANFDMLTGEGLRNNLQVNQSRLSLSIAQRRKSIANMKALPALYAYASLNSAFTARSGGNATPMGEQLDRNFTPVVGAGLRIPLFNSLQFTTGIKKARLIEQQQQNNLQIETDNFVRELKLALDGFAGAQAEYLAAKKNLLSKECAFNISEKKMENGLLPILQYMITKNDFVKAQTDLLRTKLQLSIKAKYLIFMVKGTI